MKRHKKNNTKPKKRDGCITETCVTTLRGCLFLWQAHPLVFAVRFGERHTAVGLPGESRRGSDAKTNTTSGHRPQKECTMRGRESIVVSTVHHDARGRECRFFFLTHQASIRGAHNGMGYCRAEEELRLLLRIISRAHIYARCTHTQHTYMVRGWY